MNTNEPLIYIYIVATSIVLIGCIITLFANFYNAVLKPVIRVYQLDKYTADKAIKVTDRDKGKTFKECLYLTLEAINEKATAGHTNVVIKSVNDKALQGYLRIMLEKRGFTVVVIGNDISISW